jgi:lactate dehydrogenase-like 2-hydroxyacid dehydrogenase
MAVAEFIISAIVNLADELGFDYTQKTLGIIGVGNVGFVFPTVNNIGFGLYLLPNILNNHTTTRCINDNGLIANMMKILCI